MLTKLEAVNILLDAIGEAPVNSLASGLSDAETAERILDEISKEVQGKGFHCNTEKELDLTPDVDGFIAIANNVLRVKLVEASRWLNAVPRDGRLYNVREQTFEWDDAVTADVVYYLDFESLTVELQYYITRRAATIYQTRMLGDSGLDAFLRKAEAEAKAQADDAEAESEESNILTDCSSVRQIAYRRSRLWGN